jgi:hypothetical protein
MQPTTAVCPLASVILTLVIIINILDVYLVGFQFGIIIVNIIISVFFVWLANKTCDKYQWVSWLIIAYFVITIVGVMAILTDPARYQQNTAAASAGTNGKKKVHFKE